MRDIERMQVRYYYYRNSSKHPLVTLCKIQSDDGRIGYGWAICNEKDPCRKDDKDIFDYATNRLTILVGGKHLAKGRAEAALKRGKPLDDHVWCYNRPIKRKEAIAVIWQCQAIALLNLEARGDYTLLPRSMQPYHA